MGEIYFNGSGTPSTPSQTITFWEGRIRFLVDVAFGSEVETCLLVIREDELHFLVTSDPEEEFVVFRPDDPDECGCKQWQCHGEKVAKSRLRDLRIDKGG